jgi:uncharacterized protein YlzI (FlbEa/FlbD family)
MIPSDPKRLAINQIPATTITMMNEKSMLSLNA